MKQAHATTSAEFCNSAGEVHAVMAGIHHDFYCRKSPLNFGEKDKRISLVLLQDLKNECHYYIDTGW